MPSTSSTSTCRALLLRRIYSRPSGHPTRRARASGRSIRRGPGARPSSRCGLSINTIRRPLSVNNVSAPSRFRFGACAACLCRLLACLLFTGVAFAQYRFDHWTADNGLPQNSVRDIVQTRDGYLWLATFDGLVRFDGVRFTIFNKSNSPGVITNRFVSLYEDAQGDLWASTENSGLTRLRQGRFTTYTTERGLPDNYVPAIGSDGQ